MASFTALSGPDSDAYIFSSCVQAFKPSAQGLPLLRNLSSNLAPAAYSGLPACHVLSPVIRGRDGQLRSKLRHCVS